MKQFDIVISGGAMAGGTLALAIARLYPHLSVAVVEAQTPDSAAHPGFDARSIALAQGSVAKLKTWGLWPLLSANAEPIEHIHVSDQGHFGLTRMAASDIGHDALGYVVELATVGQAYHQALSANANIHYLLPDSLASSEATPEGVRLTTRSGEVLSAKLLVVADGAQSAMATALNLNETTHDMEQVALIANVETAVAHQSRAFERFTADGPLALLPMSQGRSSLVWCLPPEKANAMLALPEAQFLAELQRAFGWRLGALTRVGKRDSYPLTVRHRPQVIAHHAVVIGNAAQTLHPIAGQGFNLGLRDVAGLLQCLAFDFPLGSPAMLNHYQDSRASDRQRTLAMTSGLVGLFSNDALPLAALRNAGLLMMGTCSAAKRPLLKQAIGWTK
uniref:2-octaprenyl-6-methoxyphenyl hydroxylase n=1 Tax=Thaumasiovibrio occultus TaxID=1891184 RepID=UPI000B3561AF|nr:2-octaprenyl-6-methoxyphenyl hydroxylase [Thaumasiovibrio occultus]